MLLGDCSGVDQKDSTTGTRVSGPHPTGQALLSTCCMPGTVLEAEGVMVRQTLPSGNTHPLGEEQ